MKEEENQESIETKVEKDDEDETEFKPYVATELDQSFDDQLVDHPQIIQYINRLKTIIRKQQKKLSKLYVKLLKEQSSRKEAFAQTEDEKSLKCNQGNDDKPKIDWDVDNGNISEQVAQVAESAMYSMAGFVLEPQSGMYYDYNSGYYYNAKLGLYYDGNSGRYLEFDIVSGRYRYKESTDDEVVVKPIERKEELKFKQKTAAARTDDKSKDVEDGELSSSSSSSSSSYDSQSVTASAIENENEARKKIVCDARFGDEPTTVDSKWKQMRMNRKRNRDWPPCMRVIVEETSVSEGGLTKGDLFIVTYEGGAIGREGDNLAILIPEAAVSKIHAKVQFDEDNYWITDMGSRNGTFINGKRISAALQESEPVKLEHKTELRIGSTTFQTHIHVGRETCEGCEPGLLQPKEKKTGHKKLRRSSKQAYREGLTALKKKFGVKGVSDQPAENYEDRAERRRNTVGSSHHAEKTQVASLEEAIPSSNKGFKMLAKMGWSEGNKLGKNEKGLSEPVPLISNEGTSGLGSSWPPPASSLQESQLRKKQAVLKTTQERYLENRCLNLDDDTD